MARKHGQMEARILSAWRHPTNPHTRIGEIGEPEELLRDRRNLGDHYSVRRARMGSIVAARQAGTMRAPTARSGRTIAEANSVSGPQALPFTQEATTPFSATLRPSRADSGRIAAAPKPILILVRCRLRLKGDCRLAEIVFFILLSLCAMRAAAPRCANVL